MKLQEFLIALDTELEINIETENGFYYIPFEKRNKIPKIFDSEIVERYTIEEFEVEEKTIKVLCVQTKGGKK